MRKISLAATLLCCFTLTTFVAACHAQSTVNGAPAPPSQGAPGRGEKALARISAALNLTPAQVAQIKPIIAATRAKAEQIRNDTTLTDAQKRDQIRSLRQSQDSQISQILTPDQIAKWKSLVAKARANRQAGAPNGGQGG